MSKKITFCFACFNEADTLKDTLFNLASTIPDEVYDVIVVDDSGNLDESLFKEFKNLKIFHNPKRLGVGYSLDFGVKQAQTDLVIFLGADIRFIPNWFDRFYSVIRSHPTSIISTVCAGLNNDRRYITGKENHYHAAHILFHVTEQNNHKKPLPFREYLECKWNKKLTGDIVNVGAPLGAIYGAHRDWFLKIRGFEGHKIWGSLEVLLALRSYVAGGDCLIDLGTVTGHIFKAAGSEKPVPCLIYNKLLIASTLLPKDMEKEVYDWAAKMQRGRQAIEMIKADQTLVSLLAGYGRESIKMMGKNEMDEEALRRIIAKTGILDP